MQEQRSALCCCICTSWISMCINDLWLYQSLALFENVTPEEQIDKNKIFRTVCRFLVAFVFAHFYLGVYVVSSVENTFTLLTELYVARIDVDRRPIRDKEAGISYSDSI